MTQGALEACRERATRSRQLHEAGNVTMTSWTCDPEARAQDRDKPNASAKPAYRDIEGGDRIKAA